MKDCDIITKHQSGFLPKDSTINQLLEIYDTIVSNLDKNNEIKFRFCDISKAFDRVWHECLLCKLGKHDIKGKILQWFKNYLSDRKQRVSTEGFHSTFKTVNAGVPQGSVLGPFLFLMYINDITNSVESKIKLFADDTSLYEIIDNNQNEISEKLTSDLGNINTWALQWDIKFNSLKTESVLFSRKRETINPDILFANDIVKCVVDHKHLGLTFSNDGKWNTHINNTFNKAYKRMNILRLLKHKVDRKSLLTIYISYIRPILEYGDVIWDNCSNQNKICLESIQLEALRIITGLRRGTSHEKLYKETGIETLECRRKNHKLILMYKILNNETPKFLADIVEPHINDNTRIRYPLRNNRLFNPPLCRTESYSKSFFPSTLNEFNQLNIEILNANTLNQFKKLIKPINNNNNDVYEINDAFKYNGQRKYNIILCQLRNNASNLNSDLYRDHLIESAACVCNYDNENIQHFMFECPLFNNARQNLTQSLSQISTENDHNHFNINSLLKGCNLCNNNTNADILKCVTQYIQETGRFHY